MREGPSGPQESPSFGAFFISGPEPDPKLPLLITFSVENSAPMLTDLRSLFARDLHKLCNEIDAFKAEEDIWRTTGSVTNSAGNLALHICGNLRHFIGAVLGGSAYSRDREREFAAKSIPKLELLEELKKTITAVDDTLVALDKSRLTQPFPIRVLPEETTTGYFLLHLHGHLNYHLGQVNYLRRML